jgi:hypothetical protein
MARSGAWVGAGGRVAVGSVVSPSAFPFAERQAEANREMDRMATTIRKANRKRFFDIGVILLYLLMGYNFRRNIAR